jgi:hypothetical protein
MSDREQEFKKTVESLFPNDIMIDSKRYQIHANMLMVGAHCIAYAVVDRYGTFDWSKPLFQTQKDTARECIDAAWSQLKKAIESDTKKRLTNKLLQKLTSEEVSWIKDSLEK